MRAQVDRLLAATAQPNVTLQVLPFGVGAHPAMYGMFHLLRFAAGELPDIVYGENLTTAFYLDKPAEVGAYAEALDRLCALASPADATPGILRKIRKDH
jgi:Domain of unknown function (DUF5753)